MKKTPKKQHTLVLSNPSIRTTQTLIKDIRTLIESTRSRVARTIDSALVLLNWHIGHRIKRDILGGERADYGEAIVSTVSRQLTQVYGQGFSRRNLFQMILLYELYTHLKIVQTLSAQLGWSHFVELLPIGDPLKRDFYAEMCRVEGWSVRILREKIGGMLFERTALSKKPAKLAKMEISKLRKEDVLSPDLVFRDPYILNFLNLKDTYQEKDLESAILREMESFIIELGAGFSFLARQKRITVGGDDFYMDMLFYNRKLKRLVVIELKLDKFKPEYKGQMELYLRWLDRHDRQPDEKAPVGMIWCAGKSDEQIELLELDKSGIHVAEYMTELPPRKLLEKKLHLAIRLARERLANQYPKVTSGK